ncbi:MAG: sugar phosphate isomerase/epimerase family protein [Planctomycetota bacterium]
MNLSYCTLQYKNTPIPALEMLADMAGAQVAGPDGAPRRYDGVEWLITSVEKLTSTERRVLGQATRSAGLTTPVLGSYIGHYNLAMTNREEVLATAERSFRIAQELGTPRVRCFVGFVCECSSIDCPPAYWAYNVAGFREVAAALDRFNREQSADLRLCLETHSQSLVDTVAGCRRFLDEVGSDRIDLNLQLEPPMLRDGIGSFLDAARALRSRVCHVHTNPETIASDAASLAAYRWLIEDGYREYFSVEGHPPWPAGKTGAELARERLAAYTAVGL